MGMGVESTVGVVLEKTLGVVVEKVVEMMVVLSEARRMEDLGKEALHTKVNVHLDQLRRDMT